MKKLSVLLLFSVFFSFQVKAQGTIVDAAVGNKDFSTLELELIFVNYLIMIILTDI